METLALLEISLRERITLLETSNWVEDLNPRQIDQLAYYFKAYSAPVNTYILREGDPSELFCLLCDGAVDILKESGSGQKKILQTLGAGKAFGEIAFFDHGTCSASIVAKKTSTLLIMDQEAFKKLCDEASSLALQITLKVVHLLSQRLRHTTGKLIDLI
ncbi:MAG: cyclic nucleotide-binding domain-containing protein [Gammaproteobacteria bacterium]